VGYLARTIRPDLFARAARRADELIQHTFCHLYGISLTIFGNAASPRNVLAALRVVLPVAIKGCGLRSAAYTSETAYLCSWRSAAPAIGASSSAEARAALSFAAGSQPGFPSSLAAVATAAHELSALCPEEPALALAFFASSVASAGLQHRLTEAAETVRLKDGLAQAQLSVVDKAHFNSCSGVWFRAGCASSSRAASRSS